MNSLDLAGVRERVLAELAARRLGPHAYADRRGQGEALYGVTGAVNVLAILGVALGSPAERQAWAAAILRWQNADGTFGPNGNGHALCMVLQALHLLGQPPPSRLAPLAPREAAALPAWLAGLDWRSTHKEFWGQTAPLLAEGVVNDAWVTTLTREVAARLSPTEPRATWCEPDAPGWRVISCIYHVLMSYDAGALPYPEPERLLTRLLALDWPARRQAEARTECSDGDWAWNLQVLCLQVPEAWPKALAQITAVSATRVAEWQAGQPELARESTHGLYCHLWVTACFQHLCRAHYRGPWLHDTLNDPTLFRLGQRVPA